MSPSADPPELQGSVPAPMLIRGECLLPAQAGWQVPDPAEVRTVLRLAGLSGSQAAQFLGLGDKGSRTVRKWAGGEAEIPFAAWALLCARANLGFIWSSDDESEL